MTKNVGHHAISALSHVIVSFAQSRTYFFEATLLGEIIWLSITDLDMWSRLATLFPVFRPRLWTSLFIATN